MHTTRLVAAIIGVSPKAVDNAISRYGRSLVAAGSRGAERHISDHVVEVLAVAFLLQRDAQMPLAAAIEVAPRVLAAPGESVSLGSIVALQVDVPRLREAIHRAAADAAEQAPSVRRGRPPKAKRGAP
jgi:hypothetical protein